MKEEKALFSYLIRNKVLKNFLTALRPVRIQLL